MMIFASSPNVLQAPARVPCGQPMLSRDPGARCRPMYSTLVACRAGVVVPVRKYLTPVILAGVQSSAAVNALKSILLLNPAVGPYLSTCNKRQRRAFGSDADNPGARHPTADYLTKPTLKGVSTAHSPASPPRRIKIVTKAATLRIRIKLIGKYSSWGT